MYLVGTSGGDSAYVVFQSDRFEVGSIVITDDCCGDGEMHPLAESFEQFMILIGNVDHIAEKYRGQEDDDEDDKIRDEFLYRLNEIYPDMNPKMVTTWERSL